MLTSPRRVLTPGRQRGWQVAGHIRDGALRRPGDATVFAVGNVDAAVRGPSAVAPAGQVARLPRPGPASRAVTIACALSATYSSAKMLEMWLLTVLPELCRARRDALVVEPLGDAVEHLAFTVGEGGRD